MKKILFLLPFAAIAFTLPSCFLALDQTVSGNGNVVNETRTVEDFHGIDAAAGLKVYVNFGEMSNEIEVEADENLQELIITEVNNGILKIKAQKAIRNADEKNIYVNAGEIDYLEVSSAAKINGRNLLITNNIEIEVSSAGNLHLELEAEKIDVEVSSSGGAHLEGSVRKMDVKISSAGNLDAYDLVAKDCSVNASSAGNARIHVTGELNADASSAGSVKYRGNPESKNISKSSAGSVSGD